MTTTTTTKKTLFPAPSCTPLPDKDGFQVSIRVDYVRLAAYFFFWTFVILAWFLRVTMDVPMLAAGVGGIEPAARQGCGPFNRDNDTTDWATNDFDLSYGKGFTFEQNHLTEAFGFPNVCTNWDYDNSRTWSNYYFPLFEYFVVTYIMLNTIQDYVLYKKGHIQKWVTHLGIFLTVVCMFCAILFRGIFVYRAYEQTRHHTFGFLTLQIALMIIAIQNTITVINSRQYYPPIKLLDTPEKVSRLAKWYLFPNLIISAVKIYATFYIVAGLNPDHPGYGPAFYRRPMFGMVFGQIIDFIWMVFNAGLPAVIAYIRGKYEDPIVITFTPPKCETNACTTSESTPLNRP